MQGSPAAGGSTTRSRCDGRWAVPPGRRGWPGENRAARTGTGVQPRPAAAPEQALQAFTKTCDGCAPSQRLSGTHAYAARPAENPSSQSVFAARTAVTLLDRLPTLAEVGNVAALMASDHASPLTATIINVTCGEIAD